MAFQYFRLLKALCLSPIIGVFAHLEKARLQDSVSVKIIPSPLNGLPARSNLRAIQEIENFWLRPLSLGYHGPIVGLDLALFLRACLVMEKAPFPVNFLPAPLKYTGTVGIVGTSAVLKETGPQHPFQSLLRAEMVVAAADFLGSCIHAPPAVEIVAFSVNGLPAGGKLGVLGEIVGFPFHLIPIAALRFGINLLSVGIFLRKGIPVKIPPAVLSVFIRHPLPAILAQAVGVEEISFCFNYGITGLHLSQFIQIIGIFIRRVWIPARPGIPLRRKEIALPVHGLPILQQALIVAEIVSAAFHGNPVSLLHGRYLLAKSLLTLREIMPGFSNLLPAFLKHSRLIGIIGTSFLRSRNQTRTDSPGISYVISKEIPYSVHLGRPLDQISFFIKITFSSLYYLPSDNPLSAAVFDVNSLFFLIILLIRHHLPAILGLGADHIDGPGSFFEFKGNPVSLFPVRLRRSPECQLSAFSFPQP